jgi:hypothetical protein
MNPASKDYCFSLLYSFWRRIEISDNEHFDIIASMRLTKHSSPYFIFILIMARFLYEINQI